MEILGIKGLIVLELSCLFNSFFVYVERIKVWIRDLSKEPEVLLEKGGCIERVVLFGGGIRSERWMSPLAK